MHKIRKSSKVGYEDLLRELNTIEQHLLRHDNSPIAMNLMVLEAKIRERFQNMEYRLIDNDPSYHYDSDEIFTDNVSVEDIQRMIPKDLATFPALDELETTKKKKRTWETVGMAALLAVVTALGVFGLASILHLALSWLA